MDYLVNSNLGPTLGSDLTHMVYMDIYGYGLSIYLPIYLSIYIYMYIGSPYLGWTFGSDSGFRELQAPGEPQRCRGRLRLGPRVVLGPPCACASAWVPAAARRLRCIFYKGSENSFSFLLPIIQIGS